MSVQVSVCYVCPRCSAGITSLEHTVSCPGCGLPLGIQKNDPYTPPYTLTEQHEKYRQPDALLDALAQLPTEKMNNIINDALLILENIGGKKTHVSDIRLAVQMGVKIGKIAEAYEIFLENGGKHYPTHQLHKQKQTQEKHNESERRPVVPEPSPSTSATLIGDPTAIPRVGN